MQEFPQCVPNMFNWVKIRATCWCFPPIDLLVFIPPLSIPTGVLGIIVLHIGGHLDMQPPRMAGDYSLRVAVRIPVNITRVTPLREIP